MTQSISVPSGDTRGVTTVVVTPTGLDAYGRCPLNYAEVHRKQRFDARNRHIQRGIYVHALIYRYNLAVIAGQAPDVDDVLTHVPIPIMPLDDDNDEERLLDFGRASLIGYRQFIQDQEYSSLLSAEQYIRTPARPVAGIPGAAIVLSGRFDVIATRPSTDGRADASDVHRIDCIDIKTTSIAADLAQRPSSFVLDHLARYAHGDACQISLIQWSATTFQTTSARLTNDDIAAGKEMCRSLVSATVGREPSWGVRVGEWCSHCPIIERCPSFRSRPGWDTEF